MLAPKPLQLCAILLAAAALAAAQKVTESALSLSASEDRCSIGRAVSTIDNTDRQIFFRFLLSRASGLTGLTVEWLAPGAQVMEFLNYEQLPNAPLMCFVTQMPVAGFDQAGKPGPWTVRVVAHGTVIHERKFTMRGDPATARGLVIRRATRAQHGDTATDIVLDGTGMSADSTIHLATYSPANAWQFISAMQPFAVEPARLIVRYPGALTPGEYWIVVKNADGLQSAPARLLIASDQGYSPPTAADEQWMITQGNYGGTSHWGRSLHAWDIAPLSLRGGGCVVAMRDGVVHTFDRGEYQNSRGHSFGNYITIQHDDGEFSHYAHLRTGTFVVRTGQRVQAGQALATVGNSGHTLGQGGGYHVHAHVTRSFAASSQSIPFTFSNLSGAARGRAFANNVTLTGSCGTLFDGTVEVSKQQKKAEPAGPRFAANVALSEWWTQTVVVSKGTRVLDILVACIRKDTQKVDVYLTSPSGAQYGGPYRPDGPMIVEKPEVGAWRISVQGVKGTGEPIEFEVRANFLR